MNDNEKFIKVIKNTEEVLKDKIPHSNPKKFLQNNNNNENYTLWALMIKHAIEKMHKSVDDLHLDKVSYDEVLDSLLKEYNSSNKKGDTLN